VRVGRPGKAGRAHVGVLNQIELDQIIAKRDAKEEQRQRMAEATNCLSAR
jgi:ferredoxin-fold anticodon binding domain-containing protein